MEKKNRRRRINGDLAEYVLLTLHKEGPLTERQIEENPALQTWDFSRDQRARRRNKRPKQSGVAETCDGLIAKNLLRLTDEAKYELTEAGKLKAQQHAKEMEIGANVLQNQILSPSAAARNTTVSYVVLSAIARATGFLTGSVGLIADGADTTVDTAASSIVWCGIKFKKEILGTITIIALMFVTAFTLVYDSANSLLENAIGLFRRWHISLYGDNY